MERTIIRLTTHDSEIPEDSKIQKRIHFIRHAESTFNKAFQENGYQGDPLKFDARLTEHGRRQVATKKSEYEQLEIDLIVVSPLTRAMQTCMGLFGHRKIPTLVSPLITEHLQSSCDIGRPASVIKKEFPNLNFDHLKEIWWWNEPGYQTLDECIEAFNNNQLFEPWKSVEDRIEELKYWLAERPEKNIAVVCHADFMHEIFNEWLDNCALYSMYLYSDKMPVAAVN